MDWVVLQVGAGLFLLFFLLSIVASTVNEALAGILKLRARMLEKGIVTLLTGSTRTADDGERRAVDSFYSHALVNSYTEDRKKPSYLSSRTFRNALLDLNELLEATSAPTDDPLRADEVRRNVEQALGAIPIDHLRSTLTTIWRSADHDATEFRAGVERWYDRAMSRVSGWYKRRIQLILFTIGLATAVLLNASAITAADRLWQDDALRQGLLAEIEQQEDAPTGAAALDRLEELGFPIGWEAANRPQGPGGWLMSIAGWLITAVAVSFGAPFWFDLLGKVSNLRVTGPKPGSVLPPGG